MRTILVAALIATSGCSLTFQERPAKPATATRGCSASKLYWIADAIGAAAIPAGFTAAVIRRDEAGDAETTAYGVAVIAGIGYLASMGNGIRWSRECGAQHETAQVAGK